MHELSLFSATKKHFSDINILQYMCFFLLMFKFMMWVVFQLNSRQE